MITLGFSNPNNIMKILSEFISMQGWVPSQFRGYEQGFIAENDSSEDGDYNFFRFCGEEHGKIETDIKEA